MFALSLHTIQLYIQQIISLAGILIILSGIVIAISQYLYSLFTDKLMKQTNRINTIRLNLGHILLLGLEFIVAADLIGTTTTPDYYTVGIVASIVIIRTVLSFTINREIASLSKNA
ncbi:MAG TPA: DUF1622 domain-containing protein [Gammaproteobacteria bacterium]|nr:DUF1622 domain-containing protein [Gammaproteobacteria bacterium]